MTKLSKLHARLNRLRAARRNLRWGTGYCGMAVAVLWTLLGAFLIDCLLETTVPQRVVLLAVCAGVLAWAFRRYTLPWLGRHESELDVALMVERQQHIDSDLVAAIQFESPQARDWGSVQLEEAVIERTAHLSRDLNVTQGIPRRPLNRRGIALLATSALVSLLIALFPAHVATFFNRLLLGSEHYPTRTVIETVKVNGRQVDRQSGPHPVVEGQPVTFEVACSGEVPEAGRVEISLLEGGGSTTIALERDQADASGGLFAGTLPRLADPVRYQIYLGDAWTDPVDLALVPLPNIDLVMRVTPPEYVTGPDVPSGEHPGMRQISVVEGSQVEVRLSADKLLQKAVLAIDEESFAMARDEARATEGDNWSLAPVGTPLEAVLEPIRFAVQVTDTHELQLERPVQGVIRIKADHAPRVMASLRTEYILPTARPSVIYEAGDDYGLARITLLRQVVRDSGTTDEDEVVVYELAAEGKPERIKNGVYRMDLEPLGLAKGDQLRVTVQATDYRGPREGKVSLSEPLVFQVTDQQGILAAITEADRQLVNEYKEMIERQIDVGEEP